MGHEHQSKTHRRWPSSRLNSRAPDHAPVKATRVAGGLRADLDSRCRRAGVDASAPGGCGRCRIVKILVRGFCLFDREFDLRRSLFRSFVAGSAACRRMLPTREFAGGHRRQQCISLGTSAAPGRNLTGIGSRLAHQFTQPLDGNNAGAHPGSRDIERAGPDEFP